MKPAPPHLTYLALPYTGMRERSFQLANMAAGYLMDQGYVVFSPISHSHPITELIPQLHDRGHDFWMYQDLPWLRLCQTMHILQVEGWMSSLGVRTELAEARKYHVTVKHLTVEKVENWWKWKEMCELRIAN
jgi:hypothetical protein